jgi:hypothetical protein
MTLLTDASENQLIAHLARAVRAGDQEAFELHVQMGVAYFDQETVARLINERVPLVLDTEHIPTLLQMLTGDGYADAVGAFTAELLQVAASNGQEIGVDLIADREDGLPVLRMSGKALQWARDHYPPHALAQARPYIRPLGT